MFLYRTPYDSWPYQEELADPNMHKPDVVEAGMDLSVTGWAQTFGGRWRARVRDQGRLQSGKSDWNPTQINPDLQNQRLGSPAFPGSAEARA